jgi:hypothetical protein
MLNLRPNAVAQSLRTRHTYTIAVITPTLDNPGFKEVIRGMKPCPEPWSQSYANPGGAWFNQSACGAGSLHSSGR